MHLACTDHAPDWTKIAYSASEQGVQLLSSSVLGKCGNYRKIANLVGGSANPVNRPGTALFCSDEAENQNTIQQMCFQGREAKAEEGMPTARCFAHQFSALASKVDCAQTA